MKYLIEKEQKGFITLLEKRKDAERDYMVIDLAFNAGLRRCELSGLNNGDLRNKETLVVRKEIAKRSKERELPLNTKIRSHIKAYFKLKAEWREDLSDEAPFFVARGARRLSKRGVYDLVKKWMRIGGLDPKYGVHALRHSFAKRLLERNGENAKVLRILQGLLGHSSLASTGVYIEPDKEEMLEAVENL